MQTLATAKRNFAIWKSKIEKAFKDELKGEIDEDDVELVVEMFVEMVTSSSKFNGDTIREALDVVSSDDDFDRNSISKEILERIQLSDAHAFPVRTIYVLVFFFSTRHDLRNAASNEIACRNNMSSSIERR